MSIEILYFGNPMCSWCWGFSPVLTSLRDEFGNDVRISLGLGSLRQETTPMSPQQKDYIRNHWRNVAKRSGQSFDFTFFEREGFCYDDRPASIAIAAARQSDDGRALDLLNRLQAAFYRDNQDITSPDIIDMICVETGLNADEMRQCAAGVDIDLEYRQTARLGVQGYPTLLTLDQGKAHLLALGYTDWPTIRANLLNLLG